MGACPEKKGLKTGALTSITTFCSNIVLHMGTVGTRHCPTYGNCGNKTDMAGIFYKKCSAGNQSLIIAPCIKYCKIRENGYALT